MQGSRPWGHLPRNVDVSGTGDRRAAHVPCARFRNIAEVHREVAKEQGIEAAVCPPLRGKHMKIRINALAWSVLASTVAVAASGCVASGDDAGPGAAEPRSGLAGQAVQAFAGRPAGVPAEFMPT